MAHRTCWLSLLALLVTVPVAVAGPGKDKNKDKNKGRGGNVEEMVDDAEPGRPALKRQQDMRVSLDQKILAVAKSDPQFAAARAELASLSKISDRTRRVAAMKAFGAKYQALRQSLLKKAGHDIAVVKRQLGAVKLKPTSFTGTVKARPTNQTITISEYPEQYTHRRNCPDGGDRWSFSGERTLIEVLSAPADNDCDSIRAGKGIRIEVPSGTKQVEVTVEYVYEMDIDIVTLGWTGMVGLSTGVRFESLSGALIGEVDLPGENPRVPVRHDQYTYISAACDIQPYCGTSTSGTAKKTFRIDVDRPGPLLVIPYVFGRVDADMLAAAEGQARIKDIRPFKVTFHR